MDRGAWRATVHGVTRVEHDLVTKPPPKYKWERNENPFVENNCVNKCWPINSLIVLMENEWKITF